jgi:hypothetical protein
MRLAPLLSIVGFALLVSAPAAAQSGSSGEVTFTRDIAPILQRSCQQCHNATGVAPMPLTTFEEVRPWSRAIKTRTGLGPRAGVMPPFFVERNIGIQHFKNNPSLSDAEIALIAKWVDAGAPRGNPADMPPPRDFANADKWTIGEPDLILRSPEIVVPAVGPDKWGSLGTVPTGLKEDRYVSALEVREVNDIPKNGPTKTVGGRYVWHHMTYSSEVPGAAAAGADDAAGGGTSWPIHEVGRNADIFPPEAGRLLAANSSLNLSAYHLHSNGRETKAHLEFGFKFFPKGYEPKYKRSTLRLGNGVDMDVKPNTANQELHSYAVLQEHTKIVAFEPHLHAPGVRMCLEAIWGQNIITLNCVGYDHNWVKQYVLRRRRGAAAAEGDHRSPDRLPRYDAGEQESGGPAQLGRRRPPLDCQHVHRPRLLRRPHRGAVPGGNGEAPPEHEEPEPVRYRLSALLGPGVTQDAD